jgi:NAD(P)-dependent dehydrogenase (short-subunit alcohol dehydrogenase family)
MDTLKDKVFILVGGARGIGRSTALALATGGARLVIADNGCDADGQGGDTNVVAACVADVTALGGSALGVTHDARLPETPRELIALAMETYGRVDGGFYSAGFVRDRALVRLSDDDFDSVLDVHVRGAFRFTRELSKALIEQKQGGSILLVSSPSGSFGTSAQASLSAASGAIASFTKTCALELRRHQIRVNAIVPTARTRLTEELPLFQAIRRDSLTPEHVAQVAAHLLSDGARDVHGELIGVAGGRVYAFRMAETSGIYYDEGPMPLEELAGAFRQVTRS